MYNCSVEGVLSYTGGTAENTVVDDAWKDNNIQNPVIEIGSTYSKVTGVASTQVPEYSTMAIDKVKYNDRDMYDVFDVKSDILSLIGNQKYTIETSGAPMWAHPYKYGRIMQGNKQIAEFGELHPTVAHKLHIKSPTVIAIIDDVNNLPKTPKYAKA